MKIVEQWEDVWDAETIADAISQAREMAIADPDCRDDMIEVYVEPSVAGMPILTRCAVIEVRLVDFEEAKHRCGIVLVVSRA